MLNGAGTVHGSCLCYLIDKCVPPALYYGHNVFDCPRGDSLQ